MGGVEGGGWKCKGRGRGARGGRGGRQDEVTTYQPVNVTNIIPFALAFFLFAAS